MRPFPLLYAACAALALSASSALGAGVLGLFPGAAGGPQNGPTVVQVELETAAGEAESIGLADLPSRLAAEPPVLIARFPGSRGAGAVEPLPDRVEVELTGSDRLVGAVGGGSGETLVLELAGGTPLPLEIDALLALRFPARLPADPGAGVEPAAEGDRLYRRVGARLDRIDGFVEGFEAGGVLFESLVGRQLVPWEELAALFIEPLGAFEPEAAGGSSLTLDLVDGTRLDAQLVSAGAARLVFEVRGGARLELEPAQIARASALGERLRYLSDVEPAAVEGGSAFGDELIFPPAASRRAVVGKL